jgi:hypothetical protein
LTSLYSVDQYPPEDEKQRASRIIRRRGGNCPNTLEVLEQLVDFNKLGKVSLVLSSVLPSSSSPGTQQIQSSFRPAVDLTHCIYREQCSEPAASYIIRSLSTDSRTIINYIELPEMTCEEFCATADKLGSEMSWCHFEAGGTVLTFPWQWCWRNTGPDTLGHNKIHAIPSSALPEHYHKCRNRESGTRRIARPSNRSQYCLLLKELGKGEYRWSSFSGALVCWPFARSRPTDMNHLKTA